MSKSEIDEINSAIADPVPQVSAPFNPVVKLIRGLVQSTEDGEVWHDTAEVRELTGADEERLAAISGKKDTTYSDYMTEILTLAVTRIGDIEVQGRKAVIDKLMLADRDVLYLAIVKATYGLTREFVVTCPSCGEKNEITINLDEDFSYVEPDFDVRKGLEVEVSFGTVKLRLPSGEDTNAVKKVIDNEAALNTLMISRCVVWPEGEEPTNKEQWARNLNVRDRRKITQVLLEAEVGPQMGEVDTQCAYCEATLPLMLDWVSLLLR